MKNIFMIVISFIIPIFILIKPLKDNKINKLEWVKKYKWQLMSYVCMVIGFLVRLIGIENLPTGLNADEASAGYESYSILNYGIDRHGKTLPVHFIAWGSGQNVLYSYIMILFVKIFGLNVFSVRLPMAIVGCISLVLFYLLFKNTSNSKVVAIGVMFLAICPWHIMKSRWGLEANIFPDLILWGVICIILGYKKKNKILYYIAFIIMAVSVYSYGTAYFFLPFFIISILIYLKIKKEINIKDIIFLIIITFVIAFPMLLFVIINTFDMPEIKIGIITIPRLTANRYQEISSVFSQEFISLSLRNFYEGVKILILQNDNQIWNSLPFFGITYIFSLPLTIIGIIKSFKKDEKKHIERIIFNIWFIISIILLFICEPNINRINIIMFPIIYYTIIGIHEISNLNSRAMIILLSVYIVSFGAFIYTYVNTNISKSYVFENGLKDVFEYIEKSDADNIYITNKIKEPYIYTLFYTKQDVNKFVNSVEYFTKGTNFDIVKQFDKYHFYIPNELEKNSLVVIKKSDSILNEEKFESKNINEYKVIKI